MQLKMEQTGNGKSKPQTSTDSSPSVATTQHQNGAGGSTVHHQNGAKYRSKSSTAAPSSSVATPTSTNSWPQQSRFANNLPLR